MFYNYLKTALRSLLKNKGFAFLNVAGLALGFMACMLIGLFVRDEYRFDQFGEKGNRIYRAYYEIQNKEGNTTAATTPPTFPQALKNNFPEVESGLRILNIKSQVLFEAKGERIYETGGILADSNFLDFFPLQLTAGQPYYALDNPKAVLLSEELAAKYFGKTNPVGQEIVIGKGNMIVTGVFRKNTHFHLDLNYVLPLSSQGLPPERLNDWGWYGFFNYVQLKKGASIDQLEKKFAQLTNPILNKEPGTTLQPHFQKLTDIHLQSARFEYDMAQRGNITYVQVLIIIAVFILLIACFNFINLATAKSVRRAKEVGVRKTIGARKSQLVFQFITETVVVVLLALCLAIAGCMLLLPAFNAFTGKQLVFDLFADAKTVAGILALLLLVSLLAGLYPAWVLSAYKPALVYKSAADGSNGRRPWLRHGLITLQFSISVILMVAAVVVVKQVRYMSNKSLGFDKDQVVFFSMRGEKMQEHYEAFKEDLLRSPHIAAATVAYGIPGDSWGDGLVRLPEKGMEQKVNLMIGDEDYVKAFDLKVVAGRTFDKHLATDVNNYVINETAAREMGFDEPAKALGTRLEWATWRKQDSIKTGQVIGVVRDYHYQSLHDKVAPTVLQVYTPAFSKVAVKLQGAHAEEALAHIRKTWNDYCSEYPVSITFLDEKFGELYQADRKIEVLISVFTFITLFISCLGLFGLAAYAAERRRKEIGVRRVLGASTGGLVVLLSREFMILVGLALLIGIPVALHFMNIWLQDFAYRIELDWQVVLTAGFIAILIAFATVSVQAIKAARSSPVKNLKAE